MRRNGFTLIELLVVMAIVGLLLSIVAPRMMNQTDQARDTALKQNLSSLRLAIDRYKADRGEYPLALESLVEERYLRRIPQDPVTGRTDTWIVVTLEEGGSPRLYDVHSGAEGNARDGTPYRDW